MQSPQRDPSTPCASMSKTTGSRCRALLRSRGVRARLFQHTVTPGPDDSPHAPAKCLAIESLVKLYAAQGREDEAAKYRAPIEC